MRWIALKNTPEYMAIVVSLQTYLSSRLPWFSIVKLRGDRGSGSRAFYQPWFLKRIFDAVSDSFWSRNVHIAAWFNCIQRTIHHLLELQYGCFYDFHATGLTVYAFLTATLFKAWHLRVEKAKGWRIRDEALSVELILLPVCCLRSSASPIAQSFVYPIEWS